MANLNRVVVTGLGTLSPIGCNVQESWRNLINGYCGIKKLQHSGYENLPCQVAGLIYDNNNKQLDLNDYFSKSELRTMAPASALALIATEEALSDARWFPQSENDKRRTGVAIGVGMVDLKDVCDTNESLKKSYNRVSPYFVPRILPNMASGHVSIRYGLRGPNHSVSTACATGAHAVGDAFRFVQRGDADVMVCGAAEASVTPLCVAAFCRLRALSLSGDPLTASRPFDRRRDGFVMAEGAAILVLENMQHALERRASIYAELLGYGLSGDAAHLTAPQPDGTGAVLAMGRALSDAKLCGTAVGYVNAHATSTPLGDAVEAKAIEALFGEHCRRRLAVSSTKGAHGHLLGASGNLETVFTVLSCKHAILPPTINLGESDDGMHLNFVANVSQQWRSTDRRIAIKNAFGFGGTNASLCIAEYR